MEFPVGFLRIPPANLSAGGLRNCDNDSRVFHGGCFSPAGDRTGAIALAKADEVDCGGKPFIAEVDYDWQVWKLLAEFLNQESAGERWHRDQDKINLSFFDDSARRACEHWKPGHLWIGQEKSLQHFLDDVWIPWSSRSARLA